MKLAAAPARLFGLDTLRVLAILVVMLYHLTIFGELPSSILPVTYFGWMGVDLFFVLSGFLIGQQALKPYLTGQQLSIKEFYRRRAYRILPAYLAVLALYVFVPGWREAPRLAPLWKFLTFTMNFGFTFDQRAFSNAWSLCVEEHFYLLLPLLVTLLMRRPSTRKTVAVLASVVLFGIGLRAFLISLHPDDIWTGIYYPSYTRLDGLVTGVALAIVRTFRPTWWDALMQRGHTLFLTGTVCIGSVIWMFRKDDLGSDSGSAMWGVILGLPLLSLGLGLITASSVSKNGLLARIRVPGAETIATLAFSLYLTHKAVAHMVMLRFPQITEPQGPASWLLYAVTCLSAAVLLHILVERPFLRLRDRVTRHKSVSALEDEMREEPAL
ncbi:acyltransferase family protein [Granulicella arctica]|uniref:Peptidoglycan/LPS O-acetylase OafA/YrhL n=1 Tax=Granulicella arctica TaxID=940613 RepID=A0A7Y9PI41_9BACT|nr:acyltransferase [Granulicella arctica]NYF80145.1 peptidoglycan/LPS O-acetylase OafA/YrhL [Granulicella arctica]